MLRLLWGGSFGTLDPACPRHGTHLLDDHGDGGQVCAGQDHVAGASVPPKCGIARSSSAVPV